MLYPPQFLERVRSHFLLSELIGRRIALKKAGREYSGLCPFHGEKTPSFTVNNEKGFFHCFGCAAHGDAIEFVKRYERLEWREAVERLAREAGIPVPVMSREEVEKERAAKTLLDVMEAACAWFEKNISVAEHSAVRDYLQQRGITQATRQQFRIGYAPEAREGLKRALISQGFAEAQLIECGLLIRPESGPSYDRFRARLMFPIRDRKGPVIAFGGRLMAAAQAKHAPKYLNSPETPLFHKSEVLFNLDLAGPAAREKNAITIVEGYMDCVSMVQAGLRESVATLGTAVTAEHLQRLWHYAPEPVLCLDGDAAGQRAMLRAAEMVLPLLKPGFSLRFAVLPSGEDPDSLIRGGGVEALQSAIAHARGIAETLWMDASREAGTGPEARAQLEHTLMELAAKVTDATVRSHMRSYFREQIWKRGAPKSHAPQRRSAEVEQLSSASDAAMRLKPVRHLLKLVLLQPALLQAPEVEDYIAHMECAAPELDRLRQGIVEAFSAHRADDAAALQAFLETAGLEGAAAALRDDRGLPIPPKVLESLHAARTTWNNAVLLKQKAMEAEYHDLALSGGADEASLLRLQEMQRQINALKKQAKMAADVALDD